MPKYTFWTKARMVARTATPRMVVRNDTSGRSLPALRENKERNMLPMERHCRGTAVRLAAMIRAVVGHIVHRIRRLKSLFCR